MEILEQCGVLWAVASFLYGTHAEQRFWVGRRRERRGAEHKCTTAMVTSDLDGDSHLPGAVGVR